MPKGVNQGASSGLQEIRNCIRRLRVEKKVHTLVLFCIFPSQVVLINHHGLKLAVFAAENIKFCGVYPDDRRFFGLVTSHVGHVSSETSSNDNFSSSCSSFLSTICSALFYIIRSNFAELGKDLFKFLRWQVFTEVLHVNVGEPLHFLPHLLLPFLPWHKSSHIDLLLVQQHSIHPLDGIVRGLLGLEVNEAIPLGNSIKIRRHLAA